MQHWWTSHCSWLRSLANEHSSLFFYTFIPWINALPFSSCFSPHHTKSFLTFHLPHRKKNSPDSCKLFPSNKTSGSFQVRFPFLSTATFVREDGRIPYCTSQHMLASLCLQLCYFIIIFRLMDYVLFIFFCCLAVPVRWLYQSKMMHQNIHSVSKGLRCRDGEKTEPFPHTFIWLESNN